jgi:hypothetical protein
VARTGVIPIPVATATILGRLTAAWVNGEVKGPYMYASRYDGALVSSYKAFVQSPGN